MAKDISAAIIGKNVDALQAALYLARIGIKVKFITDLPAFSLSESDSASGRLFWSTVLETIKHPSVEFLYNTKSVAVAGTRGSFKIKTEQRQTYVNDELCTGCKRCEENCSTLLAWLRDGAVVTEHAVRKPFPGNKSVPSAVLISKNEVSPCRASCPLNINVQGFVSLIANNKVNEAYELINSTAPLGGILGRLCKHPCESSCSRIKIDSPVSIRDLHRYAYDNVRGAGQPQVTKDAVSKGKIAIVGSGPAGLMAAWELKRRGYEPTIFESHSTFGGMLATGIPRFRLSREIREREISKVIDMGIRIRTGITVGRDINFAYLRERGYKACFLAIGASKNNRLNIPGEDLEGVIDCMSFLITLNQMNDIFVGSNIVVIGDGNTAVDSARVAIRRNMGSAKIVSWTVPEELTAAEDEIQEAFQEGVSIEYSAFPVEILGDGTRVVGVRCRRTRLTDQIMRNGRHKPEPIPGTDFIIDADHVIVAIGQSADASQLNLEGLDIDETSGTIKVNPSTLQTSVRGFFAGGDCMRGPNNVVEAMADGLKAAESIDRYVSNSDMYAGRDDKSVKVAEVDLKSISPSKSTRADMPFLDLESRKNGYEETTLGLSPDVAEEEARRCLNCALCSECMECVKVCGARAISHSQTSQMREISSDFILRFPADVSLTGFPCSNGAERPSVEGSYDFSIRPRPESDGLAEVVRTLLDLNIDSLEEIETGRSLVGRQSSSPAESAGIEGKVGVFLCRCNDNNSSHIDFDFLANLYGSKPQVGLTSEVDQACTQAGAEYVSRRIREEGIDHVVVAACRCCNNDQPCYSCNDRRILCQKYLDICLSGPAVPTISYVNIRELCAWTHKDNPRKATEKAAKKLESAIRQVALPCDTKPIIYPVNPSAVFVGASPTCDIAAMVLETLGYTVYYVNSVTVSSFSGGSSTTAQGAASGRLVHKKFPDSLEISGLPGDYRVTLEYAGGSEILEAGAVVLSSDLKYSDISKIGGTYLGNLFRRFLSRPADEESKAGISSTNKYAKSLAGAGIFVATAASEKSEEQRGESGIGLAARILLYLRSKWISALPAAVHVDSTLCRGCGNCASQCQLVELREGTNGQLCASVEQSFCRGCGSCSTVCPTGAIRPMDERPDALHSTIRACLGATPI